LKIGSFDGDDFPLAQAKMTTIVGQALDLSACTLPMLTAERYAEIVRCKTSHYSFYLPLSSAMEIVCC
jgi:geranylgeranyl pyrophosphate synthase